MRQLYKKVSNEIVGCHYLHHGGLWVVEGFGLRSFRAQSRVFPADTGFTTQIQDLVRTDTNDPNMMHRGLSELLNSSPL